MYRTLVSGTTWPRVFKSNSTKTNIICLRFPLLWPPPCPLYENKGNLGFKGQVRTKADGL